ncbi:DNA polymerase III subunit beta [Aphanothece hegewaldii CCALA 016]|uniref:DNA polymerase III subunit beta n=1 Tax=Aphanothece hegewaldii CCALA 016 TaxID=2107694 RepID=A0A2T1LT44_9CHRO|nr:DNA polymerase III subunit beta [Aphanothece hegewaldii]PSF33475.1 DNA polymerase III subunit beta [Aphanothece hegewaldii CCALA 016]
MKITCSQETLAAALVDVVEALPSKPPHPILSHVLLETAQERIKLTAFDLSIGIESYCHALIHKAGQITFEGKLFHDLVTALPNVELTLELKEHQVIELSCSHGKYQLQGMESAEYPKLPAFENQRSVVLPTKNLLEALKPCLKSCAKEEHKQVLTGVHFKFNSDAEESNSLELASTDGHRLTVTQLTGRFLLTTEPPAMTIPATPLEYLIKLIKNKEVNEVTLYYCDHQLQFQVAETILTARLLEGLYPDYETIVPRYFVHHITFLGDELLAAVNRLLLINPKGEKYGPAIVLRTNQTEQTVELFTEANAKTGTERIKADVDSNLIFGLNALYLRNALKSLSGKQFQLCLNEPSCITKLVALETELSSMFQCLMPMLIPGITDDTATSSSEDESTKKTIDSATIDVKEPTPSKITPKKNRRKKTAIAVS